MSHNPIRKDKTCLNCRHVVQERFCPNCGQENSESRKTFHHLFVHFFEDLTHYENAFWRTIKNLLFKPAALTKEYLSGKRLSYLAPVRLYIFISFITFFLITVLPNTDYNLINLKKTTTTTKSGSNTKIMKSENIKSIDELMDSEKLKNEIKDSIQADHKQSGEKKKVDHLFNFGYESIQELDSLQKFGKAEDRLDSFEYWIVKKALQVKEGNTNQQLIEKFKESFVHNFSKTLFIYMPLFAFFLWLFHGKKRWYYFDHGIFTLHYFSFILLVVLIILLYSKFLSLFGSSVITDAIKGILDFIAFAWMVYYFFPAHHRFYGETRLVSFIKSVFLFFINMLLIVIILCLFAIYTFLNLH
ncbi:DUF3667 domain-containing protein [Flavobacterium sp.]|uniref:DUF3667 domain-containing protein n=1 Tax=Flavobacterium sp. TaxID=239 RepID=UPI00286A044A|nr:DUF3667 domain-containing protein [Flavobacterium sp.]